MTVRFTSLTLGAQLMHTVASPSVAYLLLAIGLGLIVFELYTAGIGIAGVVGAACLALGLLRRGGAARSAGGRSR